MQLKDMIGRVRRALVDVPPDRYGDYDIIELLNNGQKELTGYSHKKETVEVEIEPEQENIPFPEDLLKLVNAYIGERGIELKDLNREMKRKEYGEPRSYYVRQGKLYLWPIPRVEDTVIIEYIPHPEKLTEDDDEPSIEGAAEYMVAYALRQIYMELNSPLFELWQQEKMRLLHLFVDNEDQHYQGSFTVNLRW